jgi:hypothetical protein
MSRLALTDRTGRRSLAQLERHRAWQNGYRARNRDILNEKQKEYAKRPEVKAQLRVYYRKNTIKNLLAEARKRARAQNLPYELKASDLVVPAICPVLGIPIIPGGPRDNWPSIDRHVPARGYVVDNVQIISMRANFLKRDGTLEEIEKLCKYMQLKAWWKVAAWVSQ